MAPAPADDETDRLPELGLEELESEARERGRLALERLLGGDAPAPFAAARPPGAGDEVGGVVLGAVLGRGGMGVVWSGVERRSGLLGADLDARVDVWALGVLLYQLLVGRGPWGPVKAPAALFEAILHAEVAPPSRAAPVDPTLGPIVLRCRDLMGRSFFAAADAPAPQLERRRAVVERVAAAASPRSALGIVLLGLLARVREAAGDHTGAREALRAFATPGGDAALSAIQLYELELASGELDEAARAVEQLPEVPAALEGVVTALREGDAPAALSRAILPVREVLRAYPGFFDPTLVPWLEARRRGGPLLLPPPPPPLPSLPPEHALAEVRRLLVARRAPEALALLERALAAGDGPLADPAAVEVASTTLLATSADLAARSYFERRPAPDGLARRRALLEQVAAAADPARGSGPALLGLLARVRAAAGDLRGAREALERIAAPGLLGELSRLQLFEVGLVAGDLEAAAGAAEALGAATHLPPGSGEALLSLVDALRAAALDLALARARVIESTWPGLLDAAVVPWLEGRR